VTGPPVGATVTLADQFGSDTVQVAQPEYFCNPVVKVHNGVTTRIERAVHLTCYDIKGPQRTEATSFAGGGGGNRTRARFPSRRLQPCVSVSSRTERPGRPYRGGSSCA
jgi:hypothetical protein